MTSSNLTTSRKPHLQIQSRWELGLQRMTFVGYNHAVHNRKMLDFHVAKSLHHILDAFQLQCYV